jgi:hypothetical protein
VKHEALYSAVLTTTPLLLLAMATTSGAIEIFGPTEHPRHQRLGQLNDWWADSDALLSITGGAMVSVLVLAGIIDDTKSWRYATAGALTLSILLVLAVAALHVKRRYRPDSDPDEPDETVDAAAECAALVESPRRGPIVAILAVAVGAIAWAVSRRR